ncbi:MAG: DUF4349 domain-containing protein [Defluviitaleaceae bacterium]|nr:DUF4349 domain-containing protein [Defluviitaleaceae bacterium]
MNRKLNKRLAALCLSVMCLILVVTACGRDDGFRTTSAPGNDSSWDFVGGGFVAEQHATTGRPPGNVSMAPPMADMPVNAPDASPSFGAGNQYGSAGDVTWQDVYGQNERHVIRRAFVHMENEVFDSTVEALRAVAPAVNGYIESEALTGTGTRRFTIVLRVPVATFDYALRRIETLGTVIHQNQSAEDVTDQFYDLVGNLETRRIEEERILDLIDRASDIHELLALEARLSNVRQMIASYLAQLNQMAGLISYSTITVTLTEYNPFQPAVGLSLGERIGGAFGDSVDGTVGALQGIVVFLAGAVIPLALLSIVGLVIWRIVKAVKKRAVYP